MLKRLYRFMKGYRFLLWWAMFLAIVSVVFHLYAPLLIGDMIDALSMHDGTKIPFQLVHLIIVYIGYALSNWGMMLASNQIAASFGDTLRKKLFDQLEHFPISFFDTHEHGDLISRFTNDIDMISDGLLQGLSTCLSGIVTVVLAIIFMIQINITMTCIVLLCAPFTYVVAKTITQRSSKYFIAQSKNLGALNAYTQEMLNGIRTLKAYHHEANIKDTFQAFNETLYTSGKNAQFYGSLSNPSTRLVTNASYTIIGVCGAILAIFKGITIGNISSFLIYSNTFSKPFNEVSGVMTQLQAAYASMRRIFALFDIEEEIDNGKESIANVQGKITFSHVYFGYDQEHMLMKDLSLSIPVGCRVAIVGRTGAGKTTLINLLMRFYELNGGVIYLDDIDITHMSRNELRSHFGMVLQDTYLFEDTLYHILSYGKQGASKQEVIACAKKSGAHTFIEKLPNSYDTVLKANSSYLSQGQRQLLSITRVMLMNPSILILDEATSNIDTRSEQVVASAMESLMENRTSFVIAHRLSTIIHSDLILVMEHGNIIEQGTHDELLKQKGAYEKLYQSQFIKTQDA